VIESEDVKASKAEGSQYRKRLNGDNGDRTGAGQKADSSPSLRSGSE